MFRAPKQCHSKVLHKNGMEKGKMVSLLQTELPDIQKKISRLREFMVSAGYDAAVIGRADNFSWLTCGGSNRVVRNWESGFGILAITQQNIFLVSQIMDGPRIRDEELHGLEVEPVFLLWTEKSREEKTAELLKEKRILSDIPIPGASLRPDLFHNLHYPLTEKEMGRLRLLGKQSEEVLRKVADRVRPGTREDEIANHLALEGIECEVILVGSDERIAKYRHPNPTDKKVKQSLLLHPAIRKWGLHANVTRHVCFGTPSTDLARRYAAACKVHAAALGQCIPGTKFCDILEAEKAAYRMQGFAEEWKNHYQGGITGYLLSNAALCDSPANLVKESMAFDWFITITGAKSEELSLLGDEGVEVASLTGCWPRTFYESNGKKFPLPDILVR